MAGQIKEIIDTLIKKRANGNPTIERTTKTKLILKGINPDLYNANSPDDANVLEKLKSIITELNLN
jgi:hypothetical protein